jgi:hypothetical protein
MTDEEIIEMAEKSGFMFTDGSPIGFTHSMLKDFAKLIVEKKMNPLPRYNEKGELDTRLRVDSVTGDVGIGTPKEKEHMIKDEAVILLCEHFSEGMVRTIVDAIAKDTESMCQFTLKQGDKDEQR